jgi:hypothetical protein
LPAPTREFENERVNTIRARISRRDRDIGEDYPAAGDLVRREACRLDLRLFLTTYFPNAFVLEWSEDHKKVIVRMEKSILEGGLFAISMPRGNGKTSIATRAAIWGLVYGHRRFVGLVGATDRRATDMLKTIKMELTCNNVLAVDFRQVCYPLIRLEGHARKAIGQLFDGSPTRIEWGVDRLTLPFVPERALDGVDVAGSTISVAGLTGALRGQMSTLPDGTILRPELVLLDDVQTRESAMSTSQSQDRLAIVNGDVLGMAGPDRKISAIACMTVIRAGDMADMLLDRERSPRWHGEKCRLLDSIPTDDKLWDTYAQIRAESLRKGGNGSEATDFYRQHRTAMDLGGSAAWPARHLDDEASAIQHGMNLKIDDEMSFMAEYQGSPIRPHLAESPKLTAAAIAGKTNGIKRGELPVAAEYVTGFIDVHDAALYWCVAGWSVGFDGWVCDYGTWPEQKLNYFTLRKAPHTLQRKYPGKGREGAIRAGLVDLTDMLLTRKWRREDSVPMSIGRLLIDAGYVPDVVHDVCQHSKHAALLLPSRGVGVTASMRPMSEYEKRAGDRLGDFWYLPKLTAKQAIRQMRFDANHYKSFIHARFATALGDPGSLSLFGHSPEEHRLFADHATAELPISTHGQGRSLFEWKTLPDKPDNHYFDACVGAAAAASLMGAALASLGASKPVEARPKRKSFAEAYASRWGNAHA